ncbi:MAG: S4 domain-containing protein [Bacteroidetes bacterium]|nr:S4 domain-containing protein [Rhodothermia bacterium]MCX7906668.1 S4 domain-containing protein [Bacteroidota bacterium]MDW8285077.1 S4 domain-containing protein [Bacteroidota bacterium]
MRLNRYLAQAAGISRREADAWILQGRVQVNGQPVTRPGVFVEPGAVIALDGRRIGPEPLVYVLLHKPEGMSQEEAVDTEAHQGLVRTHLRVSLRALGWLDAEASGAVVYTNDPELPSEPPVGPYGPLSLYRIQSRRTLGPEQRHALRCALPQQASVIEADLEGRILGVALREDQPALLRQALEAAGIEAASVVRIAYGGLRVHRLRLGQWRYLSEREIRALRRSFGLQPEPSVFVCWS